MQLGQFMNLSIDCSILAVTTSPDCEDAQDKLLFQFTSGDAPAFPHSALIGTLRVGMKLLYFSQAK